MNIKEKISKRKMLIEYISVVYNSGIMIHGIVQCLIHLWLREYKKHGCPMKK